MRIAVTGAAGHLGTHLCPLLAERGHDLIRVDVAEPPDGPGECRRADLAVAEQARAALAGAELVVHCASIHPWKPYRDDQYLDCNLKGTWHVLSAAAELGIARVVHTSSIAVYGTYRLPPQHWPVPEDLPPVGPDDLYQVTKSAQETMARRFATACGLRIAALRPPAFMPRPVLDTGLSLLGSFALVEDVAAAHVAAVERIDDLPSPFEAFNTTNALPYTADDGRGLAEDPRSVVERHWPGAWDWFAARGRTPSPATSCFDLAKAERLLGWRPARNFGWWWRRHGPGS